MELDFSYLDNPKLKGFKAGDILRRERQRRGWTQDICARALDISTGQYSRLENSQCEITPERAVLAETVFAVPREAFRPDIFFDRRKIKEEVQKLGE